MDWAWLFYLAGAIAFVLLFVLNRLVTPAVLPPRLLSDLQGRKWTFRELVIVVAPGVAAAMLGLVFLRTVFWSVFGALSLLMLLSALAVWAMGRRWPRLLLSQKVARVFVAYMVIALAAAVPAMAGSGIRWTHLRGLLALVVLLLFVAVVSAGALLVIGGATVYLAVAGEITRSLLLSPPATAEPEEAEAGEPEPLPTESDFEEPGARSA